MNYEFFNNGHYNPLKYTDASGYNYGDPYYNNFTGFGGMGSSNNADAPDAKWKDWLTYWDNQWLSRSFDWGGVEETANLLFDMGKSPRGLFRSENGDIYASWWENEARAVKDDEGYTTDIQLRTFNQALMFQQKKKRNVRMSVNNSITPFQVGIEWLTGTGPRQRNFSDGDKFTEMLKQHNHVLATKAAIPDLISKGVMKGIQPYSLGGIQGVEKYFIDYSTLVTGGLTGNLAVTYLGSYNLEWKVSSIYQNTATVDFLVNNSSTIQSATRPPLIGYYTWWQNSFGSWINSVFLNGPMSPTTQTFRWTETISW
jgi:hypothetical protein